MADYRIFSTTESTSKRKPEKKALKRDVKVPWTAGEKKVVMQWFTDHVRKMDVPGKADCVRCINGNPVLGKRSWTNVKDFVRNQIVRAKRLSAN